MFRRPRIGTAVIVKTINGLGTYGFVVLLPVFLINKGYSMAEWSTIWGATFISNQIFNVIFGYLGDKIGFRKTNDPTFWRNFNRRRHHRCLSRPTIIWI
ncbi:MAG: hypothetical protein E6778_22910 [Niallia nealsonii]|nr:hypothetical protein [Niallia nealsonii]